MYAPRGRQQTARAAIRTLACRTAATVSDISEALREQKCGKQVAEEKNGHHQGGDTRRVHSRSTAFTMTPVTVKKNAITARKTRSAIHNLQSRLATLNCREAAPTALLTAA
jgi:hypothetical protein